jgi:hypothetical protein
MAEMPTRIKVGPYVYEVSRDEAWLRAQEHSRSGGLRGATDHQALRIVVGPDLAPGMQRQTLWHEVKHAVLEAMTMSHDKRTDEDWIARSAPSELAVLRNNPGLVAFLTDGDDG